MPTGTPNTQSRCVLDECSRGGKFRRGMCDAHYIQLRRREDPTLSSRTRQTAPIPKWHDVAHLVEVTATGCWRWLGHCLSSGYGRVGARGILAHRLAYEELVGPIPDGLEIDHLCRNRGCVNPAHLEPVTHVENLRRAHLARKAVAS